MTDLAISEGAAPARVPNGADPPATTALPPVLPPVTAPAARRKAPPGGYPPEKIEAVRRLVVGTDMPLSAIAVAEEVSESTVKKWVAKHGWQRPEGAPPLGVPHAQFDTRDRRAKLAVRLYRAVGRQLTGLEKRARNLDDVFTEKDARTLGLLARTLTTLTELDRDTGSNVREPEIADRDTIDADLAERITRWARGGEGA